MSPNNYIEDIDFNIRQIDKLIRQGSKLIASKEDHDFVELSALGSLLHSFYNGLESIFISIIKLKGKPIPSGKNWHKELIEEIFKTSEFEKLIFPLPLKDILEEYQRFRHYFRHSYTFLLDWKRMSALVIDLKSNWKNIKKYLNNWKNNKI